MRMTNEVMENAVVTLKPFLKRTDKIGYIAARNTRVLSTELIEYTQIKNTLIKQYGETVSTPEGDTYGISPNSENFSQFMDEFSKIRSIEHDISIMKLKYSDVEGTLSGEDILSIDWMLED